MATKANEPNVPVPTVGTAESVVVIAGIVVEQSLEGEIDTTRTNRAWRLGDARRRPRPDAFARRLRRNVGGGNQPATGE